MTAEGKHARRDPVLMTWLGLSVALNVTGMASLVDRFVVWVDFIRQAVTLYQAAVRNPTLWAINFIWPTNWRRIPAVAVDLLLMWSWLFLAINLATYRAAGTTLLSDAFAKVKGFWSLLGFLLVFFISYVSAPMSALILLLSPNAYRYNVLFPHRQYMTFRILYSFIFLLGVFFIMLFLNYQIGRLASA